MDYVACPNLVDKGGGVRRYGRRHAYLWSVLMAITLVGVIPFLGGGTDVF
jgi:hypothetical protein